MNQREEYRQLLIALAQQDDKFARRFGHTRVGNDMRAAAFRHRKHARKL